LTSYSQGFHYIKRIRRCFTEATNRQYDQEYKIQAVKLAKKIGQAKAARELGIPKNTLYTWICAN
jgi:ISMsm1, transposase orfA